SQRERETGRDRFLTPGTNEKLEPICSEQPSVISRDCRSMRKARTVPVQLKCEGKYGAFLMNGEQQKTQLKLAFAATETVKPDSTTRIPLFCAKPTRPDLIEIRLLSDKGKRSK